MKKEIKIDLIHVYASSVINITTISLSSTSHYVRCSCAVDASPYELVANKQRTYSASIGHIEVMGGIKKTYPWVLYPKPGVKKTKGDGTLFSLPDKGLR